MKKIEQHGYFFKQENLDRLILATQGKVELPGFEGTTIIDWAFFCALTNHPSQYATTKPEKRNDLALFKTLLKGEFSQDAIMVELAENKGIIWFIQFQSHLLYMVGLHWDRRGSGFNAYLNVRRLDDDSMDTQNWRRLYKYEVEKSLGIATRRGSRNKKQPKKSKKTAPSHIQAGFSFDSQ